jgi:DNA polymerase-1
VNPAPRLFLVDGPSHLYRAYHALGYLSTSRGVPTNAVYGLSVMLWKLLREEQPDYVAVAWDAPGPTFRHEAFEAYKVQRPGMPEDLAQQIPHIKALLAALRIPLLEVPGFEADDILGTLVERFRPLDVEVVLVTADKDMLQLVGPRVRVLAATPAGDRVVLDEAGVREKWQVEPGQIPDLLALMGDAIDNIPGVPGVGEKTAVKLVRQFGSVERLYDNLPLVAGKLRETLARSRQQVLLSRELATVSTRAPIEIDLPALERQEPDWERLRALWAELEFSTLLKQLPPPAPRVAREGVPRLDSPEAVGRYRAGLSPGAPLAVEWWGGGGPPDPAVRGLACFHPEVGPAFVPLGERLPGLDDRVLIGHDLKLLLEWALRRGEPLPRFEDTAVAAYLLNPARQAYRLEELCLEAFGEGPPPPAGPADAVELAAALAAERARWIWRYWKHAHALLEDAGQRALYEEVERPLVPVLARMEVTGIRVAPEGLEAFAKELERELDALTREIHRLAGEPFNIGSPKQLARILFEKLKLPPLKRTKTGPSTDADVLAELALGHPLPQKILEHRTLAKLKSTYADALPGLVNPATGRIHTSFNQLVTATGRLSCLPAGTLVNTQRGLVGIEEVRPRDLIRTPLGPGRVLDSEQTGVRPVVVLRLSNGVILRCSPEHKLRSKGEWKEASSVNVGDPVYMSFREGVFGQSVELQSDRVAEDTTKKTPIIPRQWSVELAEFVGYLMADAHTARSNYTNTPAKVVLAFGWKEKDVVLHWTAVMRKLFGKPPTFRLTRTCPVLELSGVDSCGFLEQLGAGGSSKSIRVPPSLFHAPEEIVAGFLRGYFEGDGSASPNLSVRSVSREMLEGVHHLLTLFGIPSAIHAGSLDPRGYAPRHTLFILGDRSKKRFQERIGFLSVRKRAQLEGILSKHSEKSEAELLTLPDSDELLRIKSPLYDADREGEGKAPQALCVFAHGYAAGRNTMTLSRAEQIVKSVGDRREKVPFLVEAVEGGYFEVTVVGIDREPAVPMYELAVEGEQYIANGIVVHNSSEPNLQNIPIRGELGRRIREAFVPEEGWRFLAADYSQVELRLLAHLSGEATLVEAFRRGEDIHTRTAMEVFRVSADSVTPEMRRVAKGVNFGLVYGISAFGLAQATGVDQKAAQTHLENFFARHPKVKAYLETTLAEGRERGYVTTLLGRRRYLPELRASNPAARGMAERMAMNAPVQGSAADLIKVAMVRVAAALAERGLRARLLLQVHDELLFEAPPEELAGLEALAREVMEGAMTLAVPLKVDVKTGATWAEV